MKETQRLRLAVKDFAFKMENRLLEQFARGYHGWENKYCAGVIMRKLKKNLAKKDYVDVANLAMMLDRIKE